MKIHIVTLDLSGWEAYRRLRLRALQEEPQAYLSTYERSRNDPDEKWKERLQKSMEEESQWLLFARDGEELVGMLGAFVDTNNVIEIIGFYVAKEARRRGVGKRLLKELLQRIEKKRHGRRILVSANTTQGSAIALYTSFGFTLIKTERMTLGDRKEHDVVTMELQ